MDTATVYACNLGAGGIDARCALHLEAAKRDPDNADVDWSEYVEAPGVECDVDPRSHS